MADLSSELSQYGIDYNDALDRVDGNADFYKRLALKYLDDSHLVDFVASVEVKDFDEAYKAAHGLKGVSGNLSFPDLHKVASAVTEALREGAYPAAQDLLPEMEACHKRVIEGLEAWRDGQLA